MQSVLTEEDYEKRMKEYMDSSDYRENDIEQLLVYFTFRYIMYAIYDSNIMVYAYLSVMFTMIVRDMNATRFYKNGGSFTIEDQMEVARIFSKEVEHSEENVEAAKELTLQTEVPYIINRGRKGGSNVAAAICNALLYELRKER